MQTKKNINMGSYWTNDYSRKKSTSDDLLARVKTGIQNPAAFSGYLRASLQNLLDKVTHILVRNKPRLLLLCHCLNLEPLMSC